LKSPFGEYLYDSLIIFAPSVTELGGVKVDDVLDFIDWGGNVLVAADSEVSDPIRDLAYECGFEFDETETAAVDHHSFDTQDVDGSHTLLLATNFLDAPIIFNRSSVAKGVLFRGIAGQISEDNTLVLPLLSGQETTISLNPDSSLTLKNPIVGTHAVFVAALQARNNARVVISGSLELFSNEFFNSPIQRYTPEGDAPRYEQSANKEFSSQVSCWVFQEKGVIRVRSYNHTKLDPQTKAPIYTHDYKIKDFIKYTIDIQEWNGVDWVPFDSSNVQLEYSLVDPYIRTTLVHDGKAFSTSLQLPDVYGIFTFRIVHKIVGYSFIDATEIVPVRPFRHNEYDRFIVTAYPYYASLFSMFIGLFIFSLFFLYHKPTQSDDAAAAAAAVAAAEKN